MANVVCDYRFLLLLAALAFIYIQMRLFGMQSEYADRLAAAVESESHCTSQMRLLIDQISMQQGRIVVLEEESKRRELECGQLKALVEELESLADALIAGNILETKIAHLELQGLQRPATGATRFPFSFELYTGEKPLLKIFSNRIIAGYLQNREGVWKIILKGKGLQRLTDKVQVPVAAVVIMACNRADYLERTIKSVLKYQSSVASKYPLFVSQDGSNPDVKSKALSYDQLTYMQHLDYKPVQTERPGELIAYYKIASHYKWALDELFYKHKFNRVIILEDDMEIAPDFFDYFEATAALLEKDKSIMAVSSWNDNGQKQFVHDPYALYRSDFFPGLGWMLVRSTWDELSPKWPKAYWDDWLRLKENRKGRQFIRPEICRTYNFGEHGSSLGQFFKQYLEPIKMNDVQIDWKSMDLSYLMEDKFTKHFADTVKKAKPIQGTDVVLKAYNIDGDVRIEYKDQFEFERIARQFGIFEEWKDGVPRAAYKGIVVFRYQTSRRVFLVGPDSLKQLGIEGA